MNLLPLLTLTLLLGLSQAASAHDCKMACVKDRCEIVPGEERQPLAGKWQLFRQCEKQQVREGTVELRYMHKSRWFIAPPQAKGQALAKVFSDYPPDACAVLSAACVQTAMSAKQAAVGGHGLDNRVSKPGGVGDPCTLGLPCGPVLPRAEPIALRLLDGQAQGLLSLRAARGQAAETQVAVTGGRASLDGAWLQPGGLYVYQFNDASGRPIASGEFSMLSSSMAERLRQRAAQRQELQGFSAAQAWYDTLLENLLLWDALQLDLGSDW